MSVSYTGISWNRQKRVYDGALLALVLAGLALFMGLTLATNPHVTVETLVIRGTSITALLLLHVILCIGPLARLDARFLPLLYNRRHLGVTMFLLALVHGVFALVQFHALGDTNPLVSAFTAYRSDYRLFVDGRVNIAHFPFEPFGIAALLILFHMAATSHDFWLKNLGAACWKLLHLGVYLAYGLILAHVAFGALQSERSPLYPAALAVGFLVVISLHLAALRKEAALDRGRTRAMSDGFADACSVDELCEGRGRVVMVVGRRLALWRHQGRVYATSNVCRHQGGPLGEGRIVDGCITCPWHGWNYRPGDGCSPPPFQEIIETHDVRILNGRVWVKPRANTLRTACAGAPVSDPARIPAVHEALQ
jgi:methionine sulfoxide reductase heme-binding subunit